MQDVSSGARARLVWAILAALVLARGALAFVPSMWAWGLNLQRFLSPVWAWLPWAAAALLLIPPVAAAAGRRLEPFARRLMDSRAAGAGLAFVAAACVWRFPDHTWITGDFILRQSTAEAGSFPGNFAQSLPLERLLYQTFASAFGPAPGFDPNLGSRVLGALAAAALALASLSLARAWRLSGVSGLVAAAIVCFGGYLAAFTGLGKPAALLCALTALALAGASRLARGEGGGLELAGALGIALFLHRAALALMPVWVVAIALALRPDTPRRDHATVHLGMAAIVPFACAAIAAPLMWHIVQSFDAPRHLLPAGGGSPWKAAFAPLHLTDLANLAFLYTPAWPLIAVTGVSRDPARRSDGALALTLLASFVPLMLFIHPIQGVFRDLEVFAPAGVAIAIVTAYAVGTAIAEARLPARIAPALLALTVGASLQWLAHFDDAPQGLRRAQAYGIESPARSDDELAQLWDVIAYRGFRLRVWDVAAAASAQSVRYAPHPRARLMLAIARTYAGDVAGAHTVYQTLTRDLPDDPVGWLGPAGTAARLGDSLSLERAFEELHGYSRGGPEAERIRTHLQVFPEVWPPGADSLGLGAGFGD